jgi:hypothetical protein
VPIVSGANFPRPKLAKTGDQILTVMLPTATSRDSLASETIKVSAMDTFWNRGIGSYGPPGFFCTICVHLLSIRMRRDEQLPMADVHMKLVRHSRVTVLGAEAGHCYSQVSSSIPCVISAFAKPWGYYCYRPSISYLSRRSSQIALCRSRFRT